MTRTSYATEAMDEQSHRRTKKWLILGLAGLASGTVTLLVVRSVPMAAGTATAIVVSLIVLKHLGLLVAVASPFAAMMQIVRPRLRALCGQPPDEGQ